ncbi:glucokinase [Candidatus Kryptobacter tengchongensis]|nr:ROK family protein [Candidatus Kryptobacter tengchongensis]CUS91972.1 glucokinase [Candidatus Kryptobacter tengchongensis]CUT01148.1 glucokinase [Candidatus Kryptobacter tengchongensis]CUU00710.1 glucokinase [Candidatus Kryptobacter tengchongensis]CUU09322.1 glucokinase [Candidatus Kryptobacter tengchongensis]
MKKFVIGVDLGGTFIKAGIVDETGNIIIEDSIPTEAEKGPSHVIEQISKIVNKLNENFENGEIIGVGIGAPGQVDPQGGVKYPPNFPGWTVVYLAKEVEKITGLKTTVDNDANVAAIGEAKFGAGQKHPNFIMVTLGTGIGGGIIINRKIYRGPTGGAGEIGHVSINFDGPKCNCGNYGCVEAYVGQRYLSSWVAEELKINPNSKIVEIVNGDLSKIEPYIISLAAEQGDEFAINVWKKVGFYVGVMLASVMNLFDINVAIVGGGVAKAGKILFDSMNETVKSRALKPIAEKAIVIPAQLGNKAGILGAGALVFEEIS